jgi:hypothetical protein
MAALTLCALALVPARDEAAALALVAAGGGLLAGALSTTHAGPGANVAKLLFAGALGMLLARALDTPLVLLAVPIFVAGIDVASVIAGPSSVLIHQQPRIVDFVTFSLPRWGGHGAGQLGMSDLVFLAFYASAAWRHGFRRTATGVGLFLGLVATLVAGVATGEALPVLPALALGLLLPNLDRIGALLRAAEPG